MKARLDTTGNLIVKTLLLTAGLAVGVMVGYLIFYQADQVEAPSATDNTSAITNFEECVAAGNPVMESYPRKCSSNGVTYAEELTGPVQFSSEKGVNIELNDIQFNEKVSSPLKITGRVPGSWSFEADFPVVLTDSKGAVIVQTHASLIGDWMTEELVPFEVTLEFEATNYNGSGTLILQKDNPSGLPEFDDVLEVPVIFN